MLTRRIFAALKQPEKHFSIIAIAYENVKTRFSIEHSSMSGAPEAGAVFARAQTCPGAAGTVGL
jgi:hypothetical protein